MASKIEGKENVGICIALNYLGKHKRKMVIWGVELAGKQPAAIELTQRDHSTDTRLHYTGISALQYFACGDYHMDLLLTGTNCQWPFIYMWHHLQATKKCTSSLFSHVGQFTPKWWGLASMCTANREKHSHTISAPSRQVYVNILLVLH